MFIYRNWKIQSTQVSKWKNSSNLYMKREWVRWRYQSVFLKFPFVFWDFCFFFVLFCFVCCCFFLLINWNKKLKIKLWFLFLFRRWDIKHKTKWFSNCQNNWTLLEMSNFKFECCFLKSTFTIKKLAFGMTLGQQFRMAASAIIFNIAIEFKNKSNMRVRASNINIKIRQLFSKQWIIGVCVIITQSQNSGTWDELPLE